MKLLHTSDWHLGRMLYGRSLLEDQQWFLDRVLLPAVRQEKPACILLCGDIYDRQIPPVEAIRLFDRFLTQLTDLGCSICAIAGNHDGADRIALMKSALRSSGVYFATALEDAFSPVVLTEGDQTVQLFPLPYFDAAQAREFLEDPSLRGEGACMEKLLQRLLPLFQPGAAHILLSHCFAAGSLPSDSESSFFVGGSGQIPPALFDPFDYAALGHLHGPQKAGEKGMYAGSPLKYSVDEAHHHKGFTLLDWDGTVLRRSHLPVTPRRDVRRITGLFDELLAQGQARPCQDYVELVLEDKVPVFQATERLRPYYPNLLALSNPWAVAGAAGQKVQKLRGQDDVTVFSSFLQDVCGAQAEEEDLALFREILEEVRA